jgi:two-component system, probable response regulator PhcQ
MIHPVSILLVDDSELLAERLQRVFEDIENIAFAGHVKDIRSALIHIANDTPDVVMIDVHMSGENGLDLLRYNRNNYPHMINIMTSNMSDRDYYQEICLQRGAHYYLDKSSDIDHLENLLNKIIKLVR